MCGAALLWCSLSALVYVPTSGGGPRGILIACLAFAAFCTGLASLTARRTSNLPHSHLRLPSR